MKTAADYTKLITSQHKSKPNYLQTVATSIQPFVDQINIMLSVDFDLDTAVDVMLDYLGQWIGFSRVVAIPLNIYFSFDIAGLGFDQGVWFAPFDPVNGVIKLDNDSYRRLLKARVGINNWDSTVLSFNQIMQTVFEGTSVVAYVTDNQDKTVTIHVTGNVPLILKSLIDSGALIPRPGGIATSVVYS